MNGRVNHHAGRVAEGIVAEHYLRGGCAIAARRWRGDGGGEIDIVVRDATGLIFVEVKQSRSFDGAAARVTPRQLSRIFASAEEFAGNEPAGLLTEMRFDVALVDGTGDLRILENVFMN